MARTFIVDMHEGDRVDCILLARRKKLENFRNKPGQYLSLTLGDRTGELEAKVWDNAPAIADSFAEGALVRVRGLVESFQERLQLRCEGVWPANLEAVDLADFLPTSERPIPEMLGELEAVIKSVSEPNLAAFLRAVFTPEMKETFSRAPGAVRMHHAYLGGLLEHTLNVVRLLEETCRIYPALDRDLVVVGALVHDVGKLVEYRYDTTLDYSDYGRLLGHVVVGAGMVERAICEVPDFPEELAVRLRHLVISHHGKKDFGAPVVPATAEAVALHFAEYLESQVNQVLGKLAEARRRGPDRLWTDWDRNFDGPLFVGRQEAADEGEDQAPAGGQQGLPGL